MIIRGLILLQFFFFAFSGNCQDNKRNNVWVVGSSPIVTFDFNDSELKIDTTEVLSGLSSGGSNICDSAGKLLFYCNGFYLYDKTAWPMDYPDGNFDSINCPFGLKLRTYFGGNGLFAQMSIILPKKNNSYYVFTTGMSDSAYDEWKKPNPPYDFRFDVLSYHIVDMDVDMGKGKVVEKNKLLMKNARLSHNRMSAVRHANGRDWWLVKPHQNDQTFYLFLVTPDTITGPFIRQSNFSMDSIVKSAGTYGIQGQCAFSPDGEWFASTEAAYKGVFTYKFDRCNGTFEDYHFYKQPFFDTTLFDWSVGTCFSPDNKLIYLITGANIYQYDLSDTSLNSSFHITGPDTVLQYFPEYYLGYLGANDKLYIGNWNGTQNGMSYIDKPNERGATCDFKPKGLRQPYTNLLVPPNMPFYGLGKLANSPCDTIKPPVSIEIKIYPNPANDVLTLASSTFQNKDNDVAIYTLLGQCVYRKKWNTSTGIIQLELSLLRTGVYVLRVNDFVRKIVIE
jgi:hypothetical protein